MNYELAKQLKDAGWKYKDGSRAVGPTTTPTLSELIEACGEGFEVLEKFNKKWRAGHTYTYDCELEFYEEGKIPEEAVARLWLALNK